MKRAQGSLEVKLLECVNPIKNKWRVRWDVQEHDDGTADYMEAELTHKPTDEEIKDLVRKWYNQQTDAAILSGFSYEGAPVWLSQENQYNYKAAYDLAVQTDGKTLPVTFKFGTDEGSPDKPGGEIPQTKRKVIHLHHEHTRTFSIGAVDSAIRDTFKL